MSNRVLVACSTDELSRSGICKKTVLKHSEFVRIQLPEGQYSQNESEPSATTLKQVTKAAGTRSESHHDFRPWPVLSPAEAFDEVWLLQFVRRRSRPRTD